MTTDSFEFGLCREKARDIAGDIACCTRCQEDKVCGMHLTQVQHQISLRDEKKRRPNEPK